MYCVLRKKSPIDTYLILLLLLDVEFPSCLHHRRCLEMCLKIYFNATQTKQNTKENNLFPDWLVGVQNNV